MYPETDVPPIEVTREQLSQLRSRLPELPEQKTGRLIKEYGLNKKLARQLQDSPYADLFEEIAKEPNVSPTVVAATLTETFKALKRDAVEVENLKDNQITEVFRLVGSEKTTKEAIPEIIMWLSEHQDAEPTEAVGALGLGIIPKEQLESIVDELIEENRKIVEERGQKAFGLLMGTIMKEHRGRVNVEIVSTMLREKLSGKRRRKS